MDLTDLHIALLVGREHSVSAAAVQLGLAPGTVSKAISRLERQAKVTLFERLPRGMRPTEIGKVFLERVQKLDLAASDLHAELRDLRQSRTGLLRMGVGQGIPDACVLPVITSLVERGVQVQLVGGMTDSLRREVVAGELEFAVFGLFEPPGDGLAWESVARDPMLPMAPRGHVLAAPGKPVAWAALAQARWIVTGRQTSTYVEFENNFRAHGHEPPSPTVLSRSSQREVALSLAAQAVVLMPRSATLGSAASALAPVQPVGGWHSARTVGILCREGGYLSPAALHAMERFRDLLRSLD